MKRILITGAFGLVGNDLIIALQQKYGADSVIATDIRLPENPQVLAEYLDVTKKEDIEAIVKKYNVDTIYHLATLMSAGGEKNPDLAWEINIVGLKNILDVSAAHSIKVFWPSSIAVFGPNTPKINTPQHTIIEPTTMYGLNKISGELLCQYYHIKYGLDVRSVRYPGLIGWKGEPGAGTTEYSIHMLYAALREKRYVCYLKEDARLPMMYIDDAIRGALDLMEADPDRLSIRMGYNFGAINFTPGELAAEIKKTIPDFVCTFEPDSRQAIADSWPQSIDDSVARRDWNWHHEYDLPKMTAVMIEKLQIKLGVV
jgi:nucleoside-diphosphate-sugar epimerase